MVKKFSLQVKFFRLYKSPKQKHPSSVSPYKWVREEFDSPESHFPDETLLQTLRNVTHNKGICTIPPSMPTSL